MTEPELLACAEAALAKWQPRLHLDGWNIKARVTEKCSNPNHACEMSCEWREQVGEIAFPADYPRLLRDSAGGGWHKERTDAEMVEESTVHELLHFLERPLSSQLSDAWEALIGGDDSPLNRGAWVNWRDYREWWINRTTRVLIEADRSGGWSEHAAPAGVMVDPSADGSRHTNEGANP